MHKYVQLSLFSVVKREKKGCKTKKIIQAAVTYWSDLRTNIFRNYIDALFGLIPLVIIPATSLLPALLISDSNIWNYTFPISCIGIAGMYDAYGRMENHRPKNIKLGIRMSLNCIAFLLSVILSNCNRYVRLIPGGILTMCGIFLLREIWQRVTTSIQMSEWYPD